MAVSDEPVAFVRDALTRGQSRPQIADTLQKAGWTGDQIRAALASFAEIGFAVPVPRARPYLSAREPSCLAPRASRLRRAQRRATQQGRAHWARPSLTVALSRNPCQGFAIVMAVPVLSPSGS